MKNASQLEPGSEKRSHHRCRIEEVPALLGSFNEVVLTDVSAAGMGVRSAAPLQVGKQYSVRFSSDPQGLRFFGTVRWCCLRRVRSLGEGESEPVFEGGFAFEPAPLRETTEDGQVRRVKGNDADSARVLVTG